VSRIENVLLISIRSELESLRIELIYPQFCGASGGKVKYGLAAVNECDAQSLRPGVFLATFSPVKYSPTLLHTLYGSNDD
jgi:hypothetical protein